MKNPSTYTLGEIRALLSVAPNQEAIACVDRLTLCVENWQAQAKHFQVQKEIEQIRQSKEVSRRVCHSLERDILDSVTLIEA